MGDQHRLWTPEQIEVQFNVAGIGSRTMASMLDHIILTIVSIVLALTMVAVVGLFRASSSTVPDAVVALIFASIMVIWFGYFLFFEWSWNGQTPGKRAVGLRVIRDNGSPITGGHAFVRNIVRMVDFLPSSYIIGLTVMLFNRQSKRLGDLAAGTIVVKEQRRVTLDRLGAEYPQIVVDNALLPDISALTDDDLLLIRRYIQRRPSLTPDDRARLAREVLRVINPRVGWRDHAHGHFGQAESSIMLVLQAQRVAATQQIARGDPAL